MKISVVTPTYDTTWLQDAWQSLKAQSHENFEWVVVANDKRGARPRIKARAEEIRALVEGDARVVIVHDYAPFSGVGACKAFAFGHAVGEVLVELDHDDILLPSALSELAEAFEDPDVGFAYSDCADFDNRSRGQGGLTYRHPDVRPGWIRSGFTFYEATVEGPRPGVYEFVRALPPTALTVMRIGTAPNHVRAWRRSVYEAIGGHNPEYRVCDDHELMVRTYLATKMLHIPKPLYLYRITGQNTWLQHISEIQTLSEKIGLENLDKLVLRECALLGLPAYDLGGAINPRPGWKTVDLDGDVDVVADLRGRWPWEDGTVGAFRAMDFLEHLPDKIHTMREIHRCLHPGGWLLSLTPSTEGRGAFQDPTHVSYWNPNSFWYWTRDEQAKYIKNDDIRFGEVHLTSTTMPVWDQQIPYVLANLVKR